MILITGAAGLLGREIVRRLGADEYAVRGVDLSPLRMAGRGEAVAGDLLDPGFCRRVCEGADTVIHTAARQYGGDMPRWGREAFFAANFAMTRNLVDAAVAARARKIVFVSSDMVYGLPPGRPLTEADEPRPIGPYGRSKLASEEICRDARTHGVSVTVLRPRLIVGPGRLGVLKRLFDRVRFGRAVPILGDGRQRYQMVSVFDVAAAVARAVKSPGDAVYNLGSSNPPTVRDLLATLCRRADSPSAIVRLPRRAARAALWTLHAVRMSPLAPEQFRIADVDYVLDTTKARRELGWQPQWADADMLCSAYDTYVASLARRTSPESASDLQPRAAT